MKFYYTEDIIQLTIQNKQTITMCDTESQPKEWYINNAWVLCANCCGGGCPPSNLNSPYHTNHNEFCANCGPGAYYYNHTDCQCCTTVFGVGVSCL